MRVYSLALHSHIADLSPSIATIVYMTVFMENLLTRNVKRGILIRSWSNAGQVGSNWGPILLTMITSIALSSM